MTERLRIEVILMIRDKQYAGGVEINTAHKEVAIDIIKQFCESIERTYLKETGLHKYIEDKMIADAPV